jgi:hypothetical protein
MLSIKELCNPRYEIIPTSQSMMQDTCVSDNENSDQNSGEKRIIHKRNRFTLQERLEIVKELKYGNSSVSTIAIAHKTSVRNVSRWKALYS